MTIAALSVCAGARAEPPQDAEYPRSLLTRATEISSESEDEIAFGELAAYDPPEAGPLSSVSLDVGVTRLGEVSRALYTDGLLADLTGPNLSPQPISVGGITGPVRVYDAALEWDAAEAGPVRVSLLGGVRAFGLSRQWSGVPGATVALDDSASDEIVPVPVFGGSMSVALSDGWRLSGRAAGQAYDSGGTYLDLSAESSWSITPKLDLIAGYQFLDASVLGDRTTATLRTDGLYAQFKLRF